MEKSGILLVAFGSSKPEGEAAIDAVEHEIRRVYPQIEVRVAYTSRFIIRKIARERHEAIDEPAVALAKMAYDGFTDVAVLSTHIIPGEEYRNLQAVVDGFRRMGERGTKAGFRRIVLSSPLLAGSQDFERMADILTETYADEARHGAVISIGHGARHFADTAYSALQTALWRRSPAFFVGTVGGMPSFEDVWARLKAEKSGKQSVAERATLVPLLLVAGDHFTKDIAGDGEQTWKTMLLEKGYEVAPKLVGLGEVEAVRRFFVDKLRDTRSLMDSTVLS